VEIVVSTALAVALVIMLSIGAIYLTEIFRGPIVQVGDRNCPSMPCPAEPRRSKSG
jgi:hypothetical protein